MWPEVAGVSLKSLALEAFLGVLSGGWRTWWFR
jgi:hypothetical protein